MHVGISQCLPLGKVVSELWHLCNSGSWLRQAGGKFRGYSWCKWNSELWSSQQSEIGSIVEVDRNTRFLITSKCYCYHHPFIELSISDSISTLQKCHLNWQVDAPHQNKISFLVLCDLSVLQWYCWHRVPSSVWSVRPSHQNMPTFVCIGKCHLQQFSG